MKRYEVRVETRPLQLNDEPAPTGPRVESRTVVMVVWAENEQQALGLARENTMGLDSVMMAASG